MKNKNKYKDKGCKLKTNTNIESVFERANLAVNRKPSCWFWELNPDYVDLLAYVYHRVQQQVPELAMLQIGGEVDPYVRDNCKHTRMISFIPSRGPRLNLCSIINS